MKKFVIIFCVLVIASCHPLIIFNPKAVKSTSSLSLSSGAPSTKVQISIDAMGVPFINGPTVYDVIYGLGYVHARDRLFQLDMMRHAAKGKMGELFGERGLSYDYKLRLLTYRLDEQVANLSDAENTLLDHYVQGVNDGAGQRGKTAEHFFLGVPFESFTKQDVIAIARLQAWQLGTDLHAELARLKIARAAIPNEVKLELLSSVDDRGSAVLPSSFSFGQQFKLPAYSTDSKAGAHARLHIADELLQTFGGASNAWVINAAFAKDGHAMLMNDPHLQHTWPSNFYLATLSFGDQFVTGATFVGLPGILIGATKSIAWGVTASFINTQDTVLLKIAKDDGKSYVVDGKPLPFKEWPQKFCTDKKGTCKDVMYETTIFGPVIDTQFDSMIDKDEKLAVQWTGFTIEEHKEPSASFLTLARTRNVEEGVQTIKTMTLPGVNMVIADTLGNIGYAYAGLVPKRDPEQHPYLPLDGARASSKWSGFLTRHHEPSAINPTVGYLITANQNIYNSDANPEKGFGKQGAAPYRALRIKERIEGLLKNNALVDFDELSQVQLDATSIEAKELAGLIGAICVEHFAKADEYRQTFARSVRDFDGHYSVTSVQALPYEMLLGQIVAHRLKESFKEENPLPSMHGSQARYLVKNALLKELRGTKTAIFAGANDVKSQVAESCEPGYQELVSFASKRQSGWRWGLHHRLQRQSPLGKAPVVGTFFRDKKREVAGALSAPMAEAGLPVMYGANLRFRVKLSNPPEIHAVLDSGNSGTVGHKNSFDQALLWHEGKSLRMVTDWEEAKKNSKTYFELERAPNQAKN